MHSDIFCCRLSGIEGVPVTNHKYILIVKPHLSLDCSMRPLILYYLHNKQKSNYFPLDCGCLTELWMNLTFSCFATTTDPWSLCMNADVPKSAKSWSNFVATTAVSFECRGWVLDIEENINDRRDPMVCFPLLTIGMSSMLMKLIWTRSQTLDASVVVCCQILPISSWGIDILLNIILWNANKILTVFWHISLSPEVNAFILFTACHNYRLLFLWVGVHHILFSGSVQLFTIVFLHASFLSFNQMLSEPCNDKASSCTLRLGIPLVL